MTLNKFSILYGIALFLASFLAWHVGYRWANPEDSGEAQALAESQGREPSSLGSEALKANPRASAKVRPRSGSYSSLIARHQLEGRYQAMERVFPDTSTGDALRYTATLFKFRLATDSEEGQFVNELIELLKSHPQETFADLRANIEKMGPELSSERQYLMELVSDLDVDASQKINFFSEELQRASGPFKASDPSSYNGMIALRTLLEFVKKPTDAEPILRDVLVHEKDKGMRSILISTYEHVAPAEAKNLRAEFVPE